MTQLRRVKSDGHVRPHGSGGRDHLRTGQTGVADDAVEGERGEGGQEEEEAAEFAVDNSRLEVELPDVGNVGHQRACSLWAVLLFSAPLLCWLPNALTTCKPAWPWHDRPSRAASPCACWTI